MGPGWWDMETSGGFWRGQFDEPCRCSRIAVVSRSPRIGDFLQVGAGGWPLGLLYL